jgi:hypothetical protein
MLIGAVSNYRYYDLARLNKEQRDIFVKLTVEGLLAIEIRIPQMSWFNLTVLVAWFLEDEYDAFPIILMLRLP